MAQDFYFKAQALHEEFQRRELHYLNTERKLHSNIMWKKENNLPFQEYLQNINQREKETEETYRNIMKEMEGLDRHTDSMSINLQKLEILRKNLTGFPLPSWPSNVESNLQIYGTTQGFMSKSDSSKLESCESNQKSMFERNLKSVSTQTQTENIYCENCGFLIHKQPSHMMENVSLSFVNNQPRINNESQDIGSTKWKVDSNTLHEAPNNSQFIISSVNSKISTKPANEDKSFIEESYKTDKQVKEKSPGENLLSSKEISEGHNSYENKMGPNESLVMNTQNIISSNDKKLSVSHHTENENYESKSPDAEANIETFVSKSDAESMNNEFDFLESDTQNVSSKMNAQNNSKGYKSPSSDIDVSLEKPCSLVVEHASEPTSKHRKDSNTTHSNPKVYLENNKSETSGSVSGPQSPNISVVSDSDSIYEKGSSLKTSAAYQALLGNTVIPKDIKRGNSDSESEDEVENALASAVQSSNVKSKSLIQTKNSKSAPQAVDPTPAVKKDKPPPMKKPQSKLTKGTRKVLGMDTSSGSEVELALKPPEKKVDEDSDEFDFYD